MSGHKSQKKSIYQYAELSLKERLKAVWNDGERALFFSTVQDELAKKIQGHLLRRFGLTKEDCEDCFSEALEGFLGLLHRGGRPPDDIENYIWKSAENAANDLIRANRISQERAVVLVTGKSAYIEEERLRKAKESLEKAKTPEEKQEVLKEIERWEREEDTQIRSPKTEGSGSRKHTGGVTDVMEDMKYGEVDRADAGYVDPCEEVLVPEDIAVDLIEGMSNEIEADKSWAKPVVEAAVKRLPSAERKVIEHIFTYGPEYNASYAQNDLNMSPTTFRSYKSRAYNKLRQVIPDVMKEKGIVPSRPSIAEVFLQEPHPFPSLEEEETD